MYGEIRLYSGSSCPVLAQEISDYLGVPLSGRDLIRFPNENQFCRLHASARGQDVYVIQSTASPVNDNLMELLIMLQTLRLDSVGRLTSVVPYLCYSRSDKKDQPRVPIAARLVADMIEIAGSDRYMTLDLHAGQIQGFFNIPGDVLTAFHILSTHFQELRDDMKDPVVVTADLGFAKKGRNFAAKLDMPIAFIEKRRKRNEPKSEVVGVIGDVSGRDVIIVDDEVDTAGSVTQALEIVKKQGARDVYLSFVHAILSDPAFERLSKADYKSIVTTNTVHIPKEKMLPNMTVLSIAPLLAEVILRAHEGRSVGEMFNE
ncbi:MAG: ribose-phosphate pyrophosphokinase [Anaerolineaceae bacterium]|nr:ribose-phosphate pyrophosphokinase [Anaerolineaceae bacterium]|tara:strand:+ start:1012 stop:1962 length:951 start_codon:yes stop_codon:yes gene_type:complete